MRQWWRAAFACSLLVAVLAPATASASVGRASGHPGAPAIHVPRPSCRKCAVPTSGFFSSNWSGYVKTGSGFSSVSATWTVPSVSASGSTLTDSSTWVGIDGWSNSNLIQAGTEQGYNPSTHSTFYDAWWEILPASETVVFNVSPGDTIVASIAKINATQWSIYLHDTTNGRTISTTQTYSGPQTSAEFIQEAPSLGGVLPVAHYSPVAFYNARVNTVSPGLTASQEITMVQGGTDVSTPSAPNQAANGFAVANSATAPAAPATPLFQRHSDGSIWASTGVACSGTSCPGWNLLDNNRADVQIAAGAGSVFQRHSDGTIWEWAGGGCGSWCASWIELDNNPATTAIAAGSGSVWQLHSDGSIWRSTGAPCTSAGCSGWIKLDNNPAARAIAAGAGTVFQLHSDGSIWRSTGVACSGSSCPGWTELDNNPATTSIVASSSTAFQLHSDGSIWKSTGVACTGTSCPGWNKLDNNPLGANISVSNGS
jgi:Peptidase A4 family